MIRILRVTDWGHIHSINPAGVVGWSFDSRYLFVFPPNTAYMLVFDRNNGWPLTLNVSTGFNNVKKCVSYNATNCLLCYGESTTPVFFTVNLTDFSVQLARNVTIGSTFTISSNLNVFVTFDYSLSVPYFYQIHQYCTGNTFYDISQQICSVCDQNCIQCSSFTTCISCLTNYTLTNGSCTLVIVDPPV